MNQLLPLDIRHFGFQKLRFADHPQWAGMASAPRDGSYFLGWSPATADWCDICSSGPLRFCRWDAEKGNFVDSGGHWLSEHELLAWAPFLTPPDQTAMVLLDGETGDVIPDWSWDGESKP